MLKNIFFH